MPRRSRSVRDSDGRSGSLPPAFELGGQEEDLMSAGERVTWETCPRCGLSAVVGWRDGALVAVDCPGGCRLTAADFTRRGSKGLRFRPPVAPEPTGGGVARVAAGPTPSPVRSDR
jgi:hypothetical protein